MAQFSELHDASSKPWIQLSSFTALVFLLLTQNCSGLPQVVGPSQPVLATVGDDVILSCRLEPAVDATDMSIEWSRSDLDPSYVYVWWDKEELESSKHRDYKGRTSLLFSKLEFGDVSLKISKVKPSDKGKYRCFIPTLGRGSTVELVVGDFFISQSSYISIFVGLAAAIILLILAVVLFVRTRKLKGKRIKEKQEELELLKGNNSEVIDQLQQEKQKNETLKDQLEELMRNNSDTNNQLQQKKQENEILNSRQKEMEEKYSDQLTWEKQKNEALNSHLKKWMKTGRKQKTVIQNKIQQLDEINFDTNSDPTGSDEKNQLKELEKLKDEKQKWMKTVVNLKAELQKMNEELKLIGFITVEEVDEQGFYIRLKNISSEEIKLGGWELKLQINDNEPDILKFDESSKLQPEGILCLRSPNWSGNYPNDVNVVWSKLIPWLPDDTLQMKLTSNYEVIFRLF